MTDRLTPFRGRAERVLSEALRELASEDCGRSAPQAVEEHLRREFRQMVAGRERPSRLPRPRVWALAAAVLLAVAVPLWMVTRPAVPVQIATVKDVALAPAVERSGAVSSGAGLESSDARRLSSKAGLKSRATPRATYTTSRGTSRLTSRARSRVAARSTMAREVTTDFMPLAYDGVPIASGHLIRLDVPRAALVSFGLAARESMQEGTVQADVLVGEDGLARAVRFVRRSTHP